MTTYLPLMENYTGQDDELRITGWMKANGFYFAKQVITEGYKLRGTRKRIDNFSSLVWDADRIYRNYGRVTVILCDRENDLIALFNREEKS